MPILVAGREPVPGSRVPGLWADFGGRRGSQVPGLLVDLLIGRSQNRSYFPPLYRSHHRSRKRSY
eukprot:2386205-Pyramimonas_sp.AAC.1